MSRRDLGSFSQTAGFYTESISPEGVSRVWGNFLMYTEAQALSMHSSCKAQLSDVAMVVILAWRPHVFSPIDFCHWTLLCTCRYAVVKWSILRHLLNAAKALVPALWKQICTPTLEQWYDRIEDIQSAESLQALLTGTYANHAEMVSVCCGELGAGR
ncbi:Hypothetical predicted protein [Pelobates cultripes]|uniref:Uncharacterized protein n=1 Tax=Pelobates cultripes TaxID=61616 RepID=A0AAD1R3P3_PELCU|nr:Hypothetical predicted protein [Pelobates cultripes]